MVRRVGFGGSEKSRADERDQDKPPPPAAGGGKGATQLIVGAFLLVWLAAWSTAIAFSVSEIMAQGLGAADTFLFIWVGVASVFWVLAVNVLWRVLTGRPLSNGRRNRRNLSRNGGVDRGDWDHGAHD